MLRTFNCGVGLVVIAAPGDVDRVMALLRETGEAPHRIGRVIPHTDSPVDYTGTLVWPQ